MKNYLAIDTSGSNLCVVAVKDGNVFSSFTPDCAMKHSVLLMEKVEETLERAGLNLMDCDFFSAVVGAGSFTGIRIGISAVKGFALACNKPTLPITSFEVAAYNAVGEKGECKGKTLCLVDALHDSYYACGFQDGEMIYPPSYLTEEEVLSLQKEGYALRALSPLPIGEKTEVSIVDPVLGLQNAVKRRSSQENAFGELTALYVRKSSAELNLSKEVKP